VRLVDAAVDFAVRRVSGFRGRVVTGAVVQLGGSRVGVVVDVRAREVSILTAE